MVFSRGHRAWEICPAPNSRARWPMGRGREIYPAAMEKPGSAGPGRYPPADCRKPRSPGPAAPGRSRPPPAPASRRWRRFSRARARLAVSLQVGSSAGMNWKWAVTSPPQTMPMSRSGAWYRGNSRMQERRWASSCWLSWMLRPSTAPPPMVPTRRPSAPTSICAPAFRGALPRSAMRVTSTVSRCFSTS